MVFVKALKSVAMAHCLLPLTGCAVGLGLVFNAFIRGTAYSPDLEDLLFSHSMLGFALIESFMVVTIIIIGLIYTF
jgi:F0F1-type ATP synthase membrane subunit c/vacuolar-type H+-ATPase subunit K